MPLFIPAFAVPVADLKPTDNPSAETRSNPDPLEIRQENDFIIKNIFLIAFNGKEYDINWLRSDLVIRESVFQSFVTGHIVLNDSVDLPQLFPIIGEEKLKIIFTRPAVSDTNGQLPDYEAEFRVYKMTHRNVVSDRKQEYVLHFVSEEAIKNLKNKVQKSFVDKRWSEMIENIFNKYFAGRKPLELEVTKGKHKYVVPNFMPVQFFNLAAIMSVSDEGNGSNYFFYEDQEKFNYKTLGKLFQGPVKETYFYQPANTFKDDGIVLHRRELETDIVSFEKFKHTGTFDILSNLGQGMYASRLLTLDSVRKKYEIIDFDYKEKFDSMPHLYDNDVCTDDLDALGSPEASFRVATTTLDHDVVPWIASKEPGIKPNKIEKWLQKRITQLLQVQNVKIVGTVSGDPRRKAGDIIEFKVPSQVGDVDAEKPQDDDKYLNGKYFVSTVIHHLSRIDYKMELELIKDTFFSGIEHIDIKPILDPIY